jgi:hypothetical protein
LRSATELPQSLWSGSVIRPGPRAMSPWWARSLAEGLGVVSRDAMANAVSCSRVSLWRTVRCAG